MSMVGIEVRHGPTCPRSAKPDAQCKRRGCSWRAKVRGERSPRFPTLAEAQEWRRQRLGQAREARLSGPLPTITLDEAWKLWHERAKAGVLHNRQGRPYKPVTLRDYDEAMRKRVLPDYGTLALAAITNAGLKKLVKTMREDKLSASAIRNTINPLRALFRDAEEVAGVDLPNPTTGLRLPAVAAKRTEDRMPTPEQAAALVAAAPARDRAIWATAAYAGLRRGELRALRVSDIDFASGKIKVRRSWDRIEKDIDPKSGAGTRDVPIFAQLRPLLEAATKDKASNALVFGTSTGGPFDPSDVTRRADKAWKENDRFTLHELRHGFASVCIEADVNAKRLQTWMGHSKITTTFDLYGRLLDRSEAESVEKVDAYLSGTFVGPSQAARSGSQRSVASTATNGKTAGSAKKTAK